LSGYNETFVLVNVENKEEVLSLAGEALAAVMGDFDLPIPLESYVNPGARAVQTETIDEKFEQESTTAGVTVTGFVQGTATSSFADDTDLSQPGDYAEINLRSKMEITCNNLSSGYLTINGKYYFQGDPIRGKVEVGTDAIKVSGTVRLTGGYALSVSDSRRKIGAKLVLDLDVRGIEPITISPDVFSDFGEDPLGDYQDAPLNYYQENFPNPLTSAVLTIEVYDNANVSQGKLTYNADELYGLIDEIMGD
jgi:hypothetical protein